MIEMMTLCCLAFGFSLVARLLFTSTDRKPKLLLGLFVLILTGCMVEIFIKSYLVGAILATGYWLLGPLLYFYCSLRTTPAKDFSTSSVLHACPAAAYLLLLTIPQGLFSTLTLSIADIVLYELVFIHILTYFILALRLGLAKRKQLQKSASLQEQMQCAFLIFLPLASVLLFGFSFLGVNFSLISNVPVGEYFRNMVQASLTIIIIFIALLNTETRPTNIASG